MKVIDLKLFGPYKLLGNNNSFFDNDISKKNGIYLWTINYENGYLVHYIGETSRSFRIRMQEHIINILGGFYGVWDPEMLKQGKLQFVWKGLWRKDSKENINDYIDKYENFAPIFKKYLQLQSIFLAPLSVDKYLRRLIEGHIAKKIMEAPPPINNLLPTDNRYGYLYRKNNETLIVKLKCNENILGLPREIII